jgi:hypothetical protein
LVAAAKSFEVPYRSSSSKIGGTLDLLNEAEYLLNHEMLGADAADESAIQMMYSRIEATLMRARRIINERPGTAYALVLEALRELDELAVAHLDATRSI